MRTKEAVGEISGAQLGVSLTGYVLTYATLFVAYMSCSPTWQAKARKRAAAKSLPGASAPAPRPD